MSDIEYRIYDPKEDFIFKMIFGSEENKSILISLLNSILKERPYIKDVKLENNEILKLKIFQIEPFIMHQNFSLKILKKMTIITKVE